MGITLGVADRSKLGVAEGSGLFYQLYHLGLLGLVTLTVQALERVTQWLIQK